jgi:AcrR family transcriptional regulator
MRAHGWGGDPPADAEQARARIVAATVRCIERFGPQKTHLADVATELGVTRQTVYRYFTTTEDLLAATAVDAAGVFLDRVSSTAPPWTVRRRWSSRRSPTGSRAFLGSGI